jgi:hypothetical protein
MPFISDTAFDQALAWIVTNGTTLHICSSEPANYAAIAAAELAAAPVTVGAAQNGDTSGRKVVVPAITDDDVDGTGTAAFWALSNGSDTLVATGALASGQSVTAGGTYSTAAIDITVTDAAAES